MNEPPASVEYEPPEQIDPAFAQLYDRIAELEAENKQLEQRLSTETVVRNALRAENEALLLTNTALHEAMDK